MLHTHSVLNIVKSWVTEAGEMIQTEMKKQFTIEEKSNKNDLVTHVDKLVEQFLINKIKNKFPDHYVLSEEGFGNFEEGKKGTVWIIDPIDGTLNFIHQKENFAISIGVFENEFPVFGIVYDVMKKDLYIGIKGEGSFLNGKRLPLLKEDQIETSMIGLNARWLLENRRVEHEPLQKLIRVIRGSRSYGSATIEFMGVATGKLSMYIAPRLGPWDFAASKIILEEVGGVFVNFKGEEVSPYYFTSCFTGPKNLVKKVLAEEYIKEK